MISTLNFKLSEFACKCGCVENPTKLELLEALQLVRNELGLPIKISSGYRCFNYNKKIGGSASSSHITGVAADIDVPDSYYAFRIMRAIFKIGNFNRIGFGEIGDTTILHLDIDQFKLPEILWGY